MFIKEYRDQLEKRVTKAMKISINGNDLDVSLAEDEFSRSSGLMNTTKLEKDAGMLFRWPDSSPRSFWMKDTSLPLDIAFIASDGKIINIEQMTPFSLKSILSTSPASCALEVNSGWFKERGIKPGDTVDGVFNFQKIEHNPESQPTGK